MSLYDSLNADLDAILADPSGPGENVSLVRAGEESPAGAPVRGIFDRATQEVMPGSRVPVISRRPIITLKEQGILAALGRPLMKRDKVLVRGETYVVEHPMPDGMGSVAVKLLQEDETGPEFPGVDPLARLRRGK